MSDNLTMSVKKIALLDATEREIHGKSFVRSVLRIDLSDIVNPPEGLPQSLELTEEVYTRLFVDGLKHNYRPPNVVLWESTEAVLVWCGTRNAPAAYVLLDREDFDALNAEGIPSVLYYSPQYRSEFRGRFVFSEIHGKPNATLSSKLDWWCNRRMRMLSTMTDLRSSSWKCMAYPVNSVSVRRHVQL